LFYFLSLNPTAVRVQTRQHDSLYRNGGTVVREPASVHFAA